MSRAGTGLTGRRSAADLATGFSRWRPGDSGVYAGGAFTNAGGVTARYIARWDGTNWSALGSGAQSWVESLALRGPDLLAGGGFTTAGNHLANCFSIWHTGSASIPRIVHFQPGGPDNWISFTTVPGQVYAAEWSPSLAGAPWSAFTNNIPGDGATNTVVHTDDARPSPRFYRVVTSILPLD